jgi:hypothetical protein
LRLASAAGSTVIAIYRAPLIKDPARLSSLKAA